jgi:phosphoserine phosphatase
MKEENYTIDQPINAFVFDCDGTLSLIEGIEVLAEQNGVGERVHELTEYAMSEVGIRSDIYQERINLVRPTRQQTVDLAQAYFAERVPAIVAVIEALKALGKEIYVVSAGVNPAVMLFASMLGVASDHIYAVDLKFSATGEYEGYDESAHPAQDSGKRVIADLIKEEHERVIWIGDGMNDLVVKPDVIRFIGYGGAFYRPKIAENSDYYIKCKSIAPLLALGLTAQEATALTGDVEALYQEGCRLIAADEVEMV